MESLVAKLSSYNILNNLIPGAVFVFFGKLLNIMALPIHGIIERVFVYYFFGMVISRIGSLVVESLFKRFKWVTYVSKAEYASATKKDGKIETLLETSNMYRTCSGLFLSLGVVKGYAFMSNIFGIPKQITVWIAIISLLIIFSLAYIKQTRHVLSRISAVNQMQDGGAEEEKRI